MKLLEVLPDVAQVSQTRFSANFQGLLLRSATEIGDATCSITTLSRTLPTATAQRVCDGCAGSSKATAIRARGRGLVIASWK